MATLLIYASSSRCKECDSGASPAEDGHFTRMEYGPRNGEPGCGEPWDRAIHMTHYGYRFTPENAVRPGYFSDHVNELLIAEYTEKD